MNSTGRALALGLVVCGAGHAQDTESFRLRTTGGLIPDELDLIVDPVELGHVEGLHVYTNLSNLGSGDETALGSQTDNSGMIGFGGEVGRFKLGALVGTRTSELDNPVSIDLDQNGSYDLFGTGFLQGSLIEYLGWEGGNYTFRNVRDYRAASYQDLDETRLVFTTNLGLGGGRFGARVLYNDQSQDSESSDSFMNTQEDLGLDYAMTEDLLTRRYYSRSAGRELGLEIGTSRETVRGELQLAAGVIRQTTEWADIYRYDDVDLDFNPTGFIEDYRNRSTHDDEFQDETTLGLHARIGLRRTREKAAERRNDSFQHLQAVIGFDQGDRKDQYSRHVDAFDADEHFYTHEGLMVRTVEEGDVSRLHLGIDHRLVRALDDQVRFAMGVSLHHTRYTADLSGSGSSFNADSTLGSDGILNGNDRIQLDRSGTFHEREITERTTVFALPVGVEYCFSRNRKWTLRLSARYQSLVEESSDTRRITGFDPPTREVIDGSGEREITVLVSEHDNESHETSQVTDTTTFVYGLGFTPTDHLQIDFMGIFGSEDNSILDTSFFRNLRLSVSLQF